MSYQRERDAFLVQVGSTLGLDTATKLLRHATTLQRLAVAQCNGGWPCDNGERKVVPCPLCESCWVPSQIQGGKYAMAALEYSGSEIALPFACPDCRTAAAVKLLLDGTPYKAVTQGDPRGYVLKLYDKDATPEAIDNGTAQSIGVPTRNT